MHAHAHICVLKLPRPPPGLQVLHHASVLSLLLLGRADLELLATLQGQLDLVLAVLALQTQRDLLGRLGLRSNEARSDAP